jgi:outer membrane protein assembly factor BamD (BamD/ComL family)
MKNTVSGLLVFALGLMLIAGCGGLPDKGLIEKGTALEKKEKFADAIKTYEKLVKKYPKSPLCIESIYRIANIYTSGLQDYPSAVAAYDRIVKNYPDSTARAAQAQFMIGFIYNNYVQDTTRAGIAYRAFLEKFPTHDLADDVKWELQYLGKSIDEIPELAKATGQKAPEKKQNTAKQPAAVKKGKK